MREGRKICTEDCWCSPMKNLGRTIQEKEKEASDRKQQTNLKFEKVQHQFSLTSTTRIHISAHTQKEKGKKKKKNLLNQQNNARKHNS